MALKDRGVEYASSGRAIFRGCDVRDEVRINKMDYSTKVKMIYGEQLL